jgi:ribonucleotide reductase beta subunit family protein with ferritin-like domain
MSLPEPFLQPQTNRYTLFPIKYPLIYKAYKDLRRVDWIVEEINLKDDRADWEKLNKNEQHYLSHVLAFFAASDGIVMENLANRFSKDIEVAEVRHFYAQQIANEGVHSETYSLLIETYIRDQDEKDRLFNAINTIPAVQEKAHWAKKWIDSEEASFAMRLIAFAVVEGVFFSGSFCAIFWIRKYKDGLLKGLTQSNELISRDEGLHCDAAILFYSYLKNRVSQEEVHKMFREAVKIEQDFVSSALPVNLIGMNTGLMCQYIEFVADRLLVQLKYEKIWKSQNPFDWMENSSLRQKNNFFEVKVNEYSKAGMGSKSKEDTSFNLDDDF